MVLVPQQISNRICPELCGSEVAGWKNHALVAKKPRRILTLWWQKNQEESGGKLCGSRSRQCLGTRYQLSVCRKILWLLPQKESGRILWGSRSRQLSSSAPPQKESGQKLWGSRSRQLSSSAPSKKNPAENYGAPDPANFLHQRGSLKKNPAENYGAPDPANFLHQRGSLKKNPAEN